MKLGMMWLYYTPQDITHEMTSTQVPHRSGRIVQPPIRFIGFGETYEAISEDDESEFLHLRRGNV